MENSYEEKKNLFLCSIKRTVSRFVVIFGAISLLRSTREVKNRLENQIDDDVQLKLIIV